MADIITTVEGEAKTLWDKVSAWWNNTAVPALRKDEQEVIGLLQPLLSAAEGSVIQDLVQFIRGVITTVEGTPPSTLADWETAVLNSLGKLEGELLTLAKGLGSNVLQALIALVLAKLPAK